MLSVIDRKWTVQKGSSEWSQRECDKASYERVFTNDSISLRCLECDFVQQDTDSVREQKCSSTARSCSLAQPTTSSLPHSSLCVACWARRGTVSSGAGSQCPRTLSFGEAGRQGGCSHCPRHIDTVDHSRSGGAGATTVPVPRSDCLDSRWRSCAVAPMCKCSFATASDGWSGWNCEMVPCTAAGRARAF